MKAKLMVLVSSALVIAGCEVHHWDHHHDECYHDHTSPSVPRGVYSVTGDQEVTVYWEPVPDRDVAGYGVYWNDRAEGYYERLGSTSSTSYRVGGLSNGRTYFFAVDAFDHCGNESDLNYEVVYDTPRPEGYGLRVWDVDEFPDEAGIDFSEYQFGSSAMVVPYDDPGADLFLERDGDVFFITATADDTDLMAWGEVQSLDEINIAPETGWVSGGSFMAVQSHAYLVWTWDNHFAKFVVTRLRDSSILIDWAYQTDQGNPDLVPGGSSDVSSRIMVKSGSRRETREGGVH